MATQPHYGEAGASLDREDSPAAKVYEAAKPIISRLATLASEQQTAKKDIEERWLEDLRHYHGKYGTTELKEFNDADRSTAFVKLTRHKTNGWAARLSDLLLPTDGRNWGLEATPLPKLVAAAKEAVAKAQQAVEQANETEAQAEQLPPDQRAAMQRQAEQTALTAASFADQAKRTEAEQAEAKKRVKGMIEAIDDQLTESRYPAQTRDIIDDGCRLGTGILKGPLTSNRTRQEWRSEQLPTGQDQWTLNEAADPTPEFVRVDPWHFFPEMGARTIAEAEFTFERSLPTKKDLRRFARRLGFNKDGVRRLLREGPGEAPENDLKFLTDLRSITGEGEPVKNRYVMWEYHGPLECEDVCVLLRAMGMEEEARRYENEKDPLDEPRVIIHFCRGEVLKIAEEFPLDSGAPLYSVWNFQKGETSIFGYGIPNIMFDSQRAINGAWRMMMDNSGLSVGPQIVIDKGAIVPQDGNYDLKPLKVWLKSSTAHTSPNQRPFEVFNIPNNQQQLAGIIELGKMFADEETSMPLIAQGEQGQASNTLGGMSMLFNSANVVFRHVVKSFDDDLTAPTITRAFEWNMQFNPDDSIKGDMKVKALGTSVLLVREIQSQNLMFIMNQWTVHPVIGPYVKVRAGLEKTLDTMMIVPNDVLYTDDEAQANAARAQQQAAEAAAAAGGAQDPAALRMEVVRVESEARIQIAQMEQQTKLAEIASREKLTVEQVRTKYGIEQLKVDSREREKAADIAVEERREAAARQVGTDPVDAVGQGVG